MKDSVQKIRLPPDFKVKRVLSRNKERRPANFESHNKIGEVHRDCIKDTRRRSCHKKPSH